MEIVGNDTESEQLRKDHQNRIVDLVHCHLGLASVADVYAVDKGFKIETARGSILVDGELKLIT